VDTFRLWSEGVHDAEESCSLPAGAAALAEQFEPSEQCIRNWVKQADRDSAKCPDGLTTAEKEELGRLRRENRALR